MEHVKELVNEHITPTPGAVMESAKLLKKHIGDLIVIDVGGATTDLHSVTEGSEGVSRILVNPEPVAKRSVEGDLGVYVNMENIVNLIGKENLQKELIDVDVEEVMNNYLAIPKTPQQIKFVERLDKRSSTSCYKKTCWNYKKCLWSKWKK